MAGKKQLAPVRFATDDDAPVAPKSLAEAFISGDRLAELEAKRRILIGHIENPDTLARDLNGLIRADAELVKQIAEEKVLRASKRGQSDAPAPGEVVDLGDERFDPTAV